MFSWEREGQGETLLPSTTTLSENTDLKETDLFWRCGDRTRGEGNKLEYQKF